MNANANFMDIDKADCYAYRKLTYSSVRFLDILNLFQCVWGESKPYRNYISVWNKEHYVVLTVSVISHHFKKEIALTNGIL